MLTEDEKRELKELAESIAIRDEFRLLRRNSEKLQRRLDPDQFIGFLTSMSRLGPKSPAPRPCIFYERVKL
jgi:hypothetical protein